jgi:hypothetical protein
MSDELEEQLKAMRQARPSAFVRHAIVRGAMERARSESVPAPRPLRAWVPALAVFVVLVMGLWGWRSQSPEAEPLARMSTAAASAVRTIGPHRVVMSPHSSTVILPSTGKSTELALEAGAASFDIEPLPPGATFTVRTDHALVEVVGTRFQVELKGSCTLVDVQEGKVRVSQSALAPSLLTAGTRQLFCDRSTEVAGEALVRGALSLASEGNLSHAQPLFERYLLEYPGGTFEEEALYYVWLIESRGANRQAAATAAAKFLARFTEGTRAARVRRWLQDRGDQFSPLPTEEGVGHQNSETPP